MSDHRARHFLLAALAGLLVVAASLLIPPAWREALREQIYDRLLILSEPARPARETPRIVFVDIDTQSLAAIGAWPWRRDVLARLLAAVSAGEPASVAVDILLAGDDTRSPAGLARLLARETGETRFERLAADLTDGDRLLAKALAGRPTALGWVLDPHGTGILQAAPILTRDQPSLGGLWREAGLTGPPQKLLDGATGYGSLSLPGDADGIVRRVPLLLSVGDQILPGLALEALRLRTGAAGYLLTAAPLRLGIGDIAIDMPERALLRLRPVMAPVPTIRAGDLLRGKADPAALKDAIVIVGGSAPEMGALRAGSTHPLIPSAHFHVAAIRALASGIAPARPPAGGALEIGIAVGAVLLAAAAGVGLGAVLGGLSLMGLVGLLGGGAVALAAFDMLLEPVTAIFAAVVTFLCASVASYAFATLRERRLRRRFEQHLAPGVVERIVADPGSVKLTGEWREITALFTDIEGFTATTRAVGPEQLVRVLDQYFGGIARIVADHGGTIDKFVGDAVHAFFNAPLDVPDHPRRALACALAIRDWTQAQRLSGDAAAIGLGRTRLGIETGRAIVGDVGIGSKLDYTAHGDVMNVAARLEALNKETGTTICIGPSAAARCGLPLRALGDRRIAGFGTMPVYTVPEAEVAGRAA